MIQVTPQMRILVTVRPADFPRGIDGLAQPCRTTARAHWAFVAPRVIEQPSAR